MTSLGVPFLDAQNKKAPSIASTANLAAYLHLNQKDGYGNDYIHHPARVVRNLKAVNPYADADTIMAAWLHDTIEDTGIDEDFLREAGYSENCIAMVTALTKPEDDKRPYEQVIDDLIATGNRGAMWIKLADNMDNLNPQRQHELSLINPEKSARLTARYKESVKKLSAALDINPHAIFAMIECSPAPGLDASYM